MSGFCPDSEGWGPASDLRQFDLTPCFEGGVIVPSVLGVFVLVAATRTLYLQRRPIRPENAKTRKWLATKLVRGRISQPSDSNGLTSRYARSWF